MRIFDPRDGKTYKVSNLRIVGHSVPDNTTGEMRNIQCVEYTVKSKRKDWGYYMGLDAFRGANPNVRLEELGNGDSE